MKSAVLEKLGTKVSRRLEPSLREQFLGDGSREATRSELSDALLPLSAAECLLKSFHAEPTMPEYPASVLRQVYEDFVSALAPYSAHMQRKNGVELTVAAVFPLAVVRRAVATAFSAAVAVFRDDSVPLTAAGGYLTDVVSLLRMSPAESVTLENPLVNPRLTGIQSLANSAGLASTDVRAEQTAQLTGILKDTFALYAESMAKESEVAKADVVVPSGKKTKKPAVASQELGLCRVSVPMRLWRTCFSGPPSLLHPRPDFGFEYTLRRASLKTRREVHTIQCKACCVGEAFVAVHSPPLALHPPRPLMMPG